MTYAAGAKAIAFVGFSGGPVHNSGGDPVYGTVVARDRQDLRARLDDITALPHHIRASFEGHEIHIRAAGQNLPHAPGILAAFAPPR